MGRYVPLASSTTMDASHGRGSLAALLSSSAEDQQAHHYHGLRYGDGRPKSSILNRRRTETLPNTSPSPGRHQKREGLSGEHVAKEPLHQRLQS